MHWMFPTFLLQMGWTATTDPAQLQTGWSLPNCCPPTTPIPRTSNPIPEKIQKSRSEDAQNRHHALLFTQSWPRSVDSAPPISSVLWPSGPSGVLPEGCLCWPPGAAAPVRWTSPGGSDWQSTCANYSTPYNVWRYLFIFSNFNTCLSITMRSIKPSNLTLCQLGLYENSNSKFLHVFKLPTST